MSDTSTQKGISPVEELLARMIEGQQLSSMDAASLSRLSAEGKVPIESEEDVLQWLADDYGLGYTPLEDLELDRQLLSNFPTRVLLKEELLPLKQVNGTIEVAVGRLFASPGLDSLRTLTGLKLKAVLAPREALQREIKKQLGLGADTIDILEGGAALQVVEEEALARQRVRERIGGKEMIKMVFVPDKLLNIVVKG